jgi:hypothetical protein
MMDWWQAGYVKPVNRGAEGASLLSDAICVPPENRTRKG